MENVGRDFERESVRLSSGDRITRAADDPAGLAISEKLKSKIRSFRQAGRNAVDGVSLLQVADSTLGEISGAAIRLRELAMQAATETTNDGDRSFIQLEFSGLKKEIQRMANNAEFNGAKILNGSDIKHDLQVGINNVASEDRISYSLKTILNKVDDTALSGANVSSKGGAQASLDSVNKFLHEVSSGRAQIGAVMKRMESVGQVIAITDESHSASKSKIKDTDYAISAAKHASAKLKLAAGTSVLAQSNELGKDATRLL